MAYGVAGWLLVQMATQVFPFFEIPNSAVRVVVLLVALGFPVALVLAWLFDLTPRGIVRTLAAEGEPPTAASERRGIDRRLNYLLGVLLLLALGYVAFEHGLRRASVADKPLEISDAHKSIAVLPFENFSDDKGNAYFASGIQDEILTRLAGIADLKVISRTSTEKYASRPDNLKTVAAELGVATLLEGSVQKSGERVRVNVQLIDARSDTHLWASTYDRDLKDAFAVESEVSQAIADALKAKLSPSEVTALAKIPTNNAAAYDLFLKAEYELHLATDSVLDADYRQAEAHYREALALDPGFALAHARLAYCVLGRHWFLKPLPSAELAQVKQTIDRALALAPELAEAQLALGYFHYWGHRDYEPAKAAFRRALELEPNSAQAIGALAFIHRRQGEWPQALAGLVKAISYAPRDSLLVSEYGQTLQVMRRYGEAGQAAGHGLALDPGDMNARAFLNINFLFGFGDVPAARRVFDGLPGDRLVAAHNDYGDLVTLVNARVYPDLFERRFDDALRAWDTAPTATEAQRIEKLSARVAIQTVAGRARLAQPECEQLRGLLAARAAEEPDEPSILAGLSWAYVCLGRKADALRTAQHAADLLPLSKDAYSGNYYLNGVAQIAAWTGEPDEALKLIAQLLAIPAGDTMSVPRLKLDPVWDPLRGDPRFQKLMTDGEAAAKAEPHA